MTGTAAMPTTLDAQLTSPELADAEKQVERFIEERLVDPYGLLLCHLNANTLKTWTLDEIQRNGYRFSFYHAERGDLVGQVPYEDSLMATGEYAQGCMLKYEATKDPRALVRAAPPVFALLRVLDEGAKYERGYLPKPHGGMLRAAYSHEISVDQYIKTIVALRAWQTYCPPAMRNAIDQAYVDMARYHLVRDFAHPRRESMIVTPENRTHGIALFIPLMTLAHRISGEARYSEALRRFDAVLDGLLSGPVPTNCNILSLFVEGFHLAIQEGAQDPRLRQLIERLWQARMRQTQERGLLNDDASQSFETSRVLRIAAVAPLIDRYVPSAEAWRVAVRLLAAFLEPRKMLYAMGPAEALPPQHRYQLESICETSVTSWLVAYWRLRNASSQPAA